MMKDAQTLDRLVNAGKAAAAQGDVEGACRQFLKAGEAAAGDPELLTRIGRELETIGRLGRAHALYMKALEAKPDFAPAHFGVAHYYLASEQPQYALVHLGHAEAELGEKPEFRLTLGRAKLGVRETEAALLEFEKALESGFRSRELYQFLAHVLETLNRIEELGKVVNEGLKAYAGDATLTIYFAKYKKRQGQVKEAVRLLEGLDVQKAHRDVQATYHFELGWLYDELGQAESAFRCFQKANDLKRYYFEKGNFRPAQVLKVIAAQRQASWKALRKISEKGERAGASPVFLVGFPRSGTTLLDQMLDAHPGLRVLEEKPYLARQIRTLEQEFGPYPESLPKLKAEDYEKLRAAYLAEVGQVLSLKPGEHALDKLPLNLVYLPLIDLLFPKARIILALRHPCDAVLSCFMQNFAENEEMSNFLDLDRATRFYQALFGLFAAVRPALGAACHVVRYEDVVENFEREARAAIAFLGLPWDSSVLDYRSHALARGFINTPSYHQVVQPLYTRSVFRWRRYREFFAPYLERLAPSCKMFGYDL